MRTSVIAGLAAFSMIAGGASAQLAKLNTLINVDNFFSAFISTDPNVLGTSFSSGNNWQQTDAGEFTFTEPGTYYLHVHAVDQGGPRMFIGTMSLTNLLGTAQFSNGNQSLLTGVNDWLVTTTFGSNAVAPISFAKNGQSGTWGTQVQQSPDAEYIWHPLGTQVPDVYFTTTITVVPAPGMLALTGLAPLGLRRSRR
jgi:hypothetical protein